MKRLRWLILASIGLILGYVCLSVACQSGRLFLLPEQRDTRLVGAWTGTWDVFGNSSHDLTFLADDSLRVTNRGPARWGTRDGVLYVKYRSSGEGWGTGQATYHVAAAGGSVSFIGRPSIIPSRMVRR